MGTFSVERQSGFAGGPKWLKSVAIEMLPHSATCFDSERSGMREHFVLKRSGDPRYSYESGYIRGLTEAREIF